LRFWLRDCLNLGKIVNLSKRWGSHTVECAGFSNSNSAEVVIAVDQEAPLGVGLDFEISSSDFIELGGILDSKDSELGASGLKYGHEGSIDDDEDFIGGCGAAHLIFFGVLRNFNAATCGILQGWGKHDDREDHFDSWLLNYSGI